MSDNSLYTCHQWGSLLMGELSLRSHLGDTPTSGVRITSKSCLTGLALVFSFPPPFFLVTHACPATIPAFHPEQSLPHSSSNDPTFPP